MPASARTGARRRRTPRRDQAWPTPPTPRTNPPHPPDARPAAPPRTRLARTAKPVEAVSDGNRGREQVGKLSNDATLRRVLDEEAHESNAVIPLLLIEMRREEQVAKWHRHRGNVLIAQHHLPTLRDLDAFVEKRA